MDDPETGRTQSENHGWSYHHSHDHGEFEPFVYSTQQGIRAVKWSLLGLMATALIQIVIYAMSGSVALLADTIHNFGDATTAVPLWIAFRLQQRSPTKRFSYGFGRMEDIAGLVILVVILASAGLAGYEAVYRFIHPRDITHIPIVVGAAIVGFLGNEAVARYRMRVGEEIGSAALVADGHHARIDGLTSLSVIFGALGAWFGYQWADPVVGLLITVAILQIVRQTGKSVLTRLLDGTDPNIVEKIREVSGDTPEVMDVSDIRVRWVGHHMYAEINIAVPPDLSVGEGHRIAVETRQRLIHNLKYLSEVTVHVDPADASGESHHKNSSSWQHKE